MEWRNPEYADAAHTIIDCEINHPLYGWVPFAVTEGDTGAGFNVAAMRAQIIAAGNIAPYVAPAPTAADVNAERDRRLMAGKGFTPAGYGAQVMVNALDEANLNGLATTALVQVAAGNGSSIVQWRDNSDTLHDLTYDQVLDLHSQASAYKQAVFAASWALKDADPIPADYADDAHWPT